MERRNKRTAQEDQAEAPTIERQDWDEMEGSKVLPDSVAVENGTEDTAETDGVLPEEEDDNAYRNSDEACPTMKRNAFCRAIPRRKEAASTYEHRPDGLIDRSAPRSMPGTVLHQTVSISIAHELVEEPPF